MKAHAPILVLVMTLAGCNVQTPPAAPTASPDDNPNHIQADEVVIIGLSRMAFGCQYMHEFNAAAEHLALNEQSAFFDITLKKPDCFVSPPDNLRWTVYQVRPPVAQIGFQSLEQFKAAMDAFPEHEVARGKYWIFTKYLFRAPPASEQAVQPAPAVQAKGHFLIGLGVYSDKAHAKSLVDKIKMLGYPAFAEATQYQGKAAQRVRVGPYADRATAESVRLQIKQAEDKVPSNIVDVSDMPASAANRASGFAVQVGVFKSEEDANKLRDRIRGGGVASFVEKGAIGDTTWWKVRAGPYADRPGADAGLASIKEKFQITGIVTAQP